MNAPIEAPKRPKTKRRSRPEFECNEKGVWFTGIDPKEGTALPKVWVCPPITVDAYLRDDDGNNWGRLLVFRDHDDIEHSWAMPMKMLSGSCDEMRAELLTRGFDVPTNPRSRNQLTDYIQKSNPEARARSVTRPGWYKRVFVMPDRIIGESEEKVIFQTETTGVKVYSERGTLDQWRTDLADLCSGNSRLLFALSAAFAGPLLHWAGDESGGFNFQGASSSGKTTVLRAAASVWGGPDFMRRWRATDNGLESLAALHSDGILILDELGQMDPRTIGDAAYMLANGEGKSRSNRGGGGRPVATWKLIFMSAGELSLAEHMRQGGKQAQAGQETRMADIPADAGKVLGIFDTLNGYPNGPALSKAISDAAREVHGLAGPEFLRFLISQADSLSETIKSMRRDFISRYLPKRVDGQVARVANRIALVASAGELATKAGITGWESGEAMAACASCLLAWIDSRGGTGNLEPIRMIEQVRHWLESEASARLQPWNETSESKECSIVKRAGFRNFDKPGEGETFYIFPETFKTEICCGFDYRQVAKLLLQIGVMKRSGENRLACRHRLPGMPNARCFIIFPTIWQATPDGIETGNELDEPIRSSLFPVLKDAQQSLGTAGIISNS